MDDRRRSGRGGSSREAWTAERIIRLRAELGLSQAAMARKMGIRQQTVSEWETGRYEPRGASLTVLRMLAEEAGPYHAGPDEGPTDPPSPSLEP